jgi:hypothetical protein
MTDRWAACFPRSSLHAALPLRLRSGLKACEISGTIWLTGSDSFEEVDPHLRRIPDVLRYTIAADNRITRVDHRIPQGTLPIVMWSAFSSIAELHPQPAALPADLKLTVPVRLIRSSYQEQPSAMLVPIQAWSAYASTAPMIRLAPLRFAVRADGNVLILGSPLPPLAGVYLIDRAGLLLPCGYIWEPNLEPEIVRRSMNLAAKDLALFNLDGSYEWIPAESAVAASRGGARRSLASLNENAGAA